MESEILYLESEILYLESEILYLESQIPLNLGVLAIFDTLPVGPIGQREVCQK